MTTTARGLLLFSILGALVIFYAVGIDSFPDYENYFFIAEGKAGLGSESNYLFEWFSRLILELESVEPSARVDLLAVLNQIGCLIYFLWIASQSREERVFGGLFLFSLLGFMFVTTTLRASVAYLCVSAFFLRGGKFDIWGSILLLISLAWHDSAAPVVAMCISAFLISKLFDSGGSIQSKLLSSGQKILILVSATIIVTSDFVRPLISSLIVFELGARTAYFDGDGAYNLFKTLFVLLGVLNCFIFASDVRQSIFSRTFFSLLSLLVALFYVVNATMAVRFTFFVFAISLPLRGVVLFGLEKKPEIRLVSLLISPIIFYLSILYIFSNAFS